VFIQISDVAINISNIGEIFFDEDQVLIWKAGNDDEDSEADYCFEGDDMDTFMTWWNVKAEVWKG